MEMKMEMEITVASVSGQAGQTGQRSSAQLTVVSRWDQGFILLVRTCHTINITTTTYNTNTTNTNTTINII